MLKGFEMSTSLGNKAEQRLTIYTFGRFEVWRENEVLSEHSRRSSKQWKLFKYLLTHRGKGLLPETILESLWPEQEYLDPKRAVRTMVFRLRKILDQDDALHDETSYIALSQGCYQWNEQLDYWLDTEAFEVACQAAQRRFEKQPEEAEVFYREALTLYRGDFLPESSYDEWVLPVRNYYARLYIQAVLELTELCKKRQDYSAILKIMENALLIEPFEEEFHLRFLEALLKLGKTKQARAHYEYVTASFYRELGVKPSAALRDLYRLMLSDKDGFQQDLTTIQESFKDRDTTTGAFFCDADLFRLLYSLERRRGERTGHSIFLGLLTVMRSDYRLPPVDTLNAVMEKLQGVVQSSLRMGDVFCRWNESQYLLMLPGLSQEKAELVLQRIENNFWKAGPHSGDLLLTGKVQALLPYWSGKPRGEGLKNPTSP